MRSGRAMHEVRVVYLVHAKFVFFLKVGVKFDFVCLFPGERIDESLTAFVPRGLKRGFLDFGPRDLFFGRKICGAKNYCVVFCKA
jgi:hypothetical protein